MIELLTLKFTETEKGKVAIDMDFHQQDKDNLWVLSKPQMRGILLLLEQAKNTLLHDNLEDMK